MAAKSYATAVQAWIYANQRARVVSTSTTLAHDCPVDSLTKPLHLNVMQVERTYTGPQTGSEDIVEHMKSCNPRGPLVIQVAKLFPKSDVSAFGEPASCPSHQCALACLCSSLQWDALHADRAGQAPFAKKTASAVV